MQNIEWLSTPTQIVYLGTALKYLNFTDLFYNTFTFAKLQFRNKYFLLCIYLYLWWVIFLRDVLLLLHFYV